MMTRMQARITILALFMLFVWGMVHPVGAAPVPKPIVEVDDLTALVLHEARGESAKGMLAVAGVALDRVSDPRWPDTLEGVIYQQTIRILLGRPILVSQFTGMKKSRRLVSVDPYTLARAQVMVDYAWEGFRVCETDTPLLWFHATYIARPVSWPDHIVVACTIGLHVFYTDNRGG